MILKWTHCLQWLKRIKYPSVYIALSYALLSLGFILAYDFLVAKYIEDNNLHPTAHAIKELLFVICGAIIIWALVGHLRSKIKEETISRENIQNNLLEHDRMLTTLISNLPGMVYRCRNDLSWTMEFVSDGCIDLCGYEPDELVKYRNISYGNDVIHTDDQKMVWEKVQQALSSRRSFRIVYRIIDKFGQLKTVWEKGRGVFSSVGKLLAIEGIIFDITELHETKFELEKLNQAVEQNTSAILIMDLQGIIEYVNPSYSTLTGYKRQQALGMRLDELKGRDWKKGDIKKLFQLVQNGDAWRGEIPIHKKNGDKIWTKVTFSPLSANNKDPSHYLLMLHDITERKKYEKQLIRQANYDDQTGLPNRALGLDRLSQAVLNAQASQSSIGVYLVRLDNIARINETAGHNIADQLVCEISQRLANVISVQDTIARIASDEFLIISANSNHKNNPEALALRLLSEFRKPITIGEQLLSLTASVGVCLAPDDADEAPELLFNALAATKRAQDAGGDRLRFFTQELDVQARSRMEYENYIRRGLAENLFQVVYQPIIDLKSNEVISAEALVRLVIPEVGNIKPDYFIPVAEETGLIREIGQIVLTDACKAARLISQRWIKPEFSVAINVSARELGSVGYAEKVKAFLSENGLKPHNLELEITERAFLHDTEESRIVTARLRELGVRLAIDDFGTGQASISYMRRFPIHKLKLDKSYVSKINSDHDQRAFTSAILALAHELDLRVVGEGIETESEAVWLRFKGCDYGQGYFFSRPLALNEFLEYPKLLSERKKLQAADEKTYIKKVSTTKHAVR